MAFSPLKHLASRMPAAWQLELKRQRYRGQIARDVFATDEPEYALLASFLREGDWAIDVGANVGHYCKRMSDLVGAKGRVIAFEPVAHTFSLLAANMQNCKHQNVTLVNAAASDVTGVARISIPRFDNGAMNYYEASINTDNEGVPVMTLSIDALQLDSPVRLLKIDAEGHEMAVLRGSINLLKRFRPILIVEVSTREVHSFLDALGYLRETLPNSPNHLYR
jgi:FkbM family methyltransferase